LEEELKKREENNKLYVEERKFIKQIQDEMAKATEQLEKDKIVIAEDNVEK